MVTKPSAEQIGTRLRGHAMAYGWARPSVVIGQVLLVAFDVTDNSTGVSAREHRLR